MSTKLSARKTHPMPFVRIELAVLSVREDTLQVLLGRRAEPPHEGSMALPGGVLRIDLDDSLDAACQRVAQERLGVNLPGATQLMAIGGPSRDPRAPWALSVVYRCMTLADELDMRPGKRLAELRWVSTEGKDLETLAFDHPQLVGAAVEALRQDVDALRFPPGLINEPFSLADLQGTCEVVRGEKLDKSSFRRRLDAAQRVEAVEGALKTGAFRPAQLFKVSREDRSTSSRDNKG